LFSLAKIVLLTISNILMQLKDKLTKILINNFYLVNMNKVNITIYIVRLTKDFCLEFLK